MPSRGYTYRARQRPAEMLQSVACLVGAGKTVAARAAVARLDASRYQLIAIPNPQVGARGIHHAVVAALGGVPASTTPPSSPRPPGTWPPSSPSRPAAGPADR